MAITYCRGYGWLARFKPCKMLPLWTRVVTNPGTIVAAAVAYPQSRFVIDFNHCAAPSHNIILSDKLNDTYMHRRIANNNYIFNII